MQLCGLGSFYRPYVIIDAQTARFKELLDGADIYKTIREITDVVSDGAAAATGGPARVDESLFASLDKYVTTTETRALMEPPVPPSVSLADVSDDARGTQALASLEQFVTARRRYVNDLRDDKDLAHADIQAWERRRTEVRKTIEWLGKYMGDPVFVALFNSEIGFAFVDYHTELLPRMSNVVNALRKLPTRYEAAIRRAEQENRNFESNLVLLRQARRSRDEEINRFVVLGGSMIFKKPVAEP